MINLIGKTRGKYRILEEIGRGGMATVYKAVDTTTRQTVALKVLPPYFQHDPALLRRFQREAEAAARLCHRHIVQIYEAGQAQEVSYIAMEYVPHGSLQAQLQASQPLDFTLALTITSQIASALDYAAQRGVIHRDVKPSNILLGQDKQGQLRAMLADFGIARAMEHSLLTQSGSVLGTPEYMSPEQAEGERPDHRSDLYSLGVVLYQMLTGLVPFSGESTPAVLHAQVYDPPPRPSALNRRLGAAVEAVLLKGLAKRPEERFQSGAEMVTALRRAMASPQAELVAVVEAPTLEEVSGHRVTPRPVRKAKSIPWLLLGGLMVGVLAVWAILMALFTGWPPSPTPTVIVRVSPSLPPTWPATWTSMPTDMPLPLAPTSTLVVRETPTATPSLTPTATDTPVLPTATPTSCTLDAALVADVTVSGGTIFSPRARIDKIWRIRNSGSCPWESGYTWVFVSGNLMGGTASQTVPATAAGGNVDIGLTMYAPSAPGTYTGYWRMKSPDGEVFGQTCSVSIVVPSSATATPIATSTSPPPPGAEISLTVDRDSINAGECTWVRARVEYVRAAYLDGEPVVGGHKEKEICPCNDTTYTLHVELTDGSTTDRTVTVYVAGVCTPAAPAPTRILFDETHSEYFRIDSGLVHLVSELRKAGYTVSSLKSGPITEQILSGHDILVIPEPFTPPKPFTNQEIETIKEFVHDGGGLLLIALGWSWVDYSGRPIHENPANQLGREFGMVVNDDLIVDPTNNNGDEGYPLYHTFANHPIVKNLNIVTSGMDSSLAISGSALAIVRGDEDAYSTYHQQVYQRGEYPPVAAASEYGLGRIVYLGHAAFWDDERLYKYDNLQFAVGAFEWLAGAR